MSILGYNSAFFSHWRLHLLRESSGRCHWCRSSLFLKRRLLVRTTSMGHSLLLLLTFIVELNLNSLLWMPLSEVIECGFVHGDDGDVRWFFNLIVCGRFPNGYDPDNSMWHIRNSWRVYSLYSWVGVTPRWQGGFWLCWGLLAFMAIVFRFCVLKSRISDYSEMVVWIEGSQRLSRSEAMTSFTELSHLGAYGRLSRSWTDSNSEFQGVEYGQSCGSCGVLLRCLIQNWLIGWIGIRFFPCFVRCHGEKDLKSWPNPIFGMRHGLGAFGRDADSMGISESFNHLNFR